MCKLQGPGPVLQGRPFRKDELQTLAKQYVNAMRAFQPAGPFGFLAMCDGVRIAQEMILELEAMGEEVGLFAILDTWVLENSQIPVLQAVDYYVDRMRRFRHLPLRQQLAAVQRTLKRVVGQDRAGSGWGRAYWPGDSFQQPTFRAPVLLFKRPRQPYYYVRDLEMGWGARSTGGVEISEVPCGHYEFLRQPYVRLIAEKLSERLAKLRERSEATTLGYPAVHLASPVPSEIASPQLQ